MTTHELAAPAALPEVENPIFDLIAGLWLSRAVFTAAKLGIADCIGDKARTAAEIADAIGAKPDTTYRLLRALAEGGYFEEREGQAFVHTPLSLMLKSDDPNSLRATVISELGEDHYAAWEHLPHSIKTGQTAFPKRFGMPVWEYYQRNPESGDLFKQSMTGFNQQILAAISAAYSFSGAKTILDIGGGEGAMLSLALDLNRSARGILFDQPQVIEAARARLESAGLASRCDFVGGSFFDGLPSGADMHLMKWILHDWNDGESQAILRQSRQAISSSGKLVLLESILPSAEGGLTGKLMDLNMLVMTGGRERTLAEWNSLLESCSWRIERVVPTRSPVFVIEARPV